MQIRSFDVGGINTYSNPLIPATNDYTAVSGLTQVNQGVQQDGVLLRAVNVDSYPLGGKQKRPGYAVFGTTGTADGVAPTKLFNWIKDDGTTSYVYRSSGSSLYYYDAGAGTGDWTLCGNGTISAGGTINHAILGNTLIISDANGTTRHTTNGTSFTDTPLAPPMTSLVQYQNRIYGAGTSSNLFYSTSNDATNWNTSGTSDSSSIAIPDEGRLLRVMKLNNTLVIGKTSGKEFAWDGYNLLDLATNLGPTSAQSFATVEDHGFHLNRLGVFTSTAGNNQLISNAIQREIYNDAGLGIAGTIFNPAPGVVHRYDYFLSVGSVQDDLTNEPLNNAILKYNYQKNEWLNYQFNDNPTAYVSFKDNTGNQQLLFSNSGGQVFQFGGTATSDNGTPIASVMDMLYHFNYPYVDKEFRYIWLFFNPGCQAKVQVAITDTFIKGAKKWVDIGDVSSGIKMFRFPNNSKGKLLWLRITESSGDARFDYYGMACDANLNPTT